MDQRHELPAITELTRGMTRGEDEAFRMFYQQYQPRLYRYLWVVTRGRDADVRDALQATLLRVVKYVRVFDDETIFWSWLARVARTALADGQKQQRRYWAFLDWFRPHASRDFAPPQNARATNALVDHTDADARLLGWLDDAVAELPADERALIEGRYFAQTPLRALASETARTEKAVQLKLARIRDKLRKALAARVLIDEAS